MYTGISRRDLGTSEMSKLRREEMKMVIWKDIAVPITQKMTHIRRIGGKVYRSFINTFGDVPVVRFNNVTGKIEPVVNLRGRAYAARNRRSYRK